MSTAERPDSERIEALQQENRQLRSQLLDVQTKMSKLIASMQTVNDAVAKTLDDTDTANSKDTQKGRFDDMDQGSSGSSGQQEPGPSTSHFLALNSSLPPASFETPAPKFGYDSLNDSQQQHLVSGPSFTSTELINPAGTSPLHPQIPNIWSFEYQMGVQPYLAAMTATESSSLIRGKDWTLSNSPFSDHILLLQHLLKGKLSSSGLAPRGQNQIQG